MEILHIAHRTAWEAALLAGTYRVSSGEAMLEDVGFIHASTGAQLNSVAERFYVDDPEELVVLVLDDDAIRAAGIEVQYEDAGDGELYPHIYGAIDPSWVAQTRPGRFDERGQFQS
ncbi:MAG: DUF952 domain-containing protein [Microbacteriaceae bacterium]